jgi:hypothetical protein
MGALAYSQRWAAFFKKYDHWRYFFAEWNKVVYLKSYRKHHPVGALEKSLHHGIRWLIHSITQGPDCGSGTYYHHSGWTSSYPETTGYIIPSLLRYAQTGDGPWAESAESAAFEAGKWLLEVQRNDGGWPGGYMHQHRDSVVFNTGQIIRGMRALYLYTGEEVYKQSAHRAIEWIWDQLDAEGKFSSNDFMGAVRVYGTYVVAPILAWAPHFEADKDVWEAKARMHLDWVLTQQQENFWLANCDNTLHKNHKPIIHTIAYTLDGLFDAGCLLKEAKYKIAAIGGAEVLAQKFVERGLLHGRYDKQWCGSEAFIPTGGAQLAILWNKIAADDSHSFWAVEARSSMNTLLSVIATSGARTARDVGGALQGSFPMWGRYETFGLPNWATKYMVDSLMNELNWSDER